MSDWATRANRVIRAARAEAAEQGLDPAATLALVDAAYPFGMRKYHPYQMWLKERRRLCGDLPGVRPLQPPPAMAAKQAALEAGKAIEAAKLAAWERGEAMEG
jgi:hypothetical protein